MASLHKALSRRHGLSVARIGPGRQFRPCAALSLRLKPTSASFRVKVCRLLADAQRETRRDPAPNDRAKEIVTMSKFAGTARCRHVPTAIPTIAPAEQCATCGTADNRRFCLTCGHVGCCDSLAGHAKAHAEATGHWVMTSLPLSRIAFVWCYACSLYVIGPTNHPAAVGR